MANPFDQFTVDVGAALPGMEQPGFASYGQPPAPAYGQPYDYNHDEAAAPPSLAVDDANPFNTFDAAPVAYSAAPMVAEGYPSYNRAAGVPEPSQPPPPPPQEPPPPPPMQAYAADPWGGAPLPPPQQQQQQLPFSAPPPSGEAYFGGPPPPAAAYGAPPMPPNQQPYGDPNYPGALVVAPQQSNPYAQAQAPVPPYAQQQGYDPNYGQATYGMPQPAAPVDPFSVFESAPAPAPVFNGPPSTSTAMVPAAPAAAAATGDDFWSNFTPAQAVDNLNITDSPIVVDEKKTEEGLPEGGEWYDARIFTPTLGVMFFKPQELTDSLFLNTDKELVDSLGDRPVVAFIVEGSSARSAGVELGHVLVKVNGQDVRNPKEASRLIKEGPRPLPLLFYVPATDVVTAEGEHMVKYDTKETIAPNSAKEWKPKYVVIGGIIAQPWMMNMYRSKSEYDIAVIETQARRPVSVKVKQFSLQGARIQNDWQGPQMVKYKNKIHPWKYIVVLPVARNPIKISSPNLSQLKPVHEGIRRVLLAQQRGRSGGNSRATGPDRSNEADYNQGASQRSVSRGNNGGSAPSRSSQPQQQKEPDLISQDLISTDLLGSQPPPPPPMQQQPPYMQQQQPMLGYDAGFGGYGQQQPPPPQQQYQQPPQAMVPMYPGAPPQQYPQQPMANGFYGAPPAGADAYAAGGYGAPPAPPQQALVGYGQPQPQYRY